MGGGGAGAIAFTTPPFAQSIFFGISPVVKRYHPLPNPITSYVWFNDSAGDIDFNQMFLSQSETTIFIKVYCKDKTSENI